ncbi:MAG: TonB family protein [Acidobacteria bacterium]|nr:TonB family protein [Acidobacteriota bacterium]
MSLSPPAFGAKSALQPALSERRRHARALLPGDDAIPLMLNRKEAGSVLNVSESGVGFSSAGRRLRTGSTASLWFGLPGSKERVEASGVIAWTGPSGRAGVRFLHVPKSSQELLQSWLAEADEKASGVDLNDPEVKAAELAINSRNLDFEDALSLIAERARALTRADGAAIALAGDNGFLCRATTGNAPDLGLALDPDSGLSGECIRSGKVVRCDDTEQDGRVDKVACQALELRSTVIVPILPDDEADAEVSGILEVLSSVHRNFAGRDVLLLRQFAALIHRLAVTEHSPPPVAKAAADPVSVLEFPRSAAIATDVDHEETARIDSPKPVLCDVCGHENLPATTNCGKCEAPLPTVSRQAEPVGIKVQVPAPAAFHEAAPATAVRELQRKKPIPRGTVLFFTAALLLLSAAGYGGWRYWHQEDADATPADAGAPAGSAVVESQPATATKPSPPPATPPAAIARKSITPDKTAAVSAKASKTAAKPQEQKPEPVPEQTAASAPPPAEQAMAPPIVSVPDKSALAALTTTLPSQPTRVSQGAQPAILIRKTAPIYPPAARQRRVQGTVVLQAIIKPDGSVGDVQVESGDRVLAYAAMRAVKQWVYKPGQIDGQPVEVQTRILVKFSLP